jgi:hypothetical protein
VQTEAKLVLPGNRQRARSSQHTRAVYECLAVMMQCSHLKSSLCAPPHAQHAQPHNLKLRKLNNMPA